MCHMHVSSIAYYLQINHSSSFVLQSCCPTIIQLQYVSFLILLQFKNDAVHPISKIRGRHDITSYKAETWSLQCIGFRRMEANPKPRWNVWTCRCFIHNNMPKTQKITDDRLAWTEKQHLCILHMEEVGSKSKVPGESTRLCQRRYFSVFKQLYLLIQVSKI